MAIRVLGVGRVEHRVAEHAAGRIVAAPDLLEHHLDLARDLVRIEERVEDRVAEHVDSGRERVRGRGGVVDGHVVRRVGVDPPARALDLSGDLAEPAPLGALEQHVLVEMGEAALVVALVGGARARPELELGDRGGVGLVQHDREPVRELLANDTALAHDWSSVPVGPEARAHGALRDGRSRRLPARAVLRADLPVLRFSRGRGALARARDGGALRGRAARRSSPRGAAISRAGGSRRSTSAAARPRCSRRRACASCSTRCAARSRASPPR